jgi:hypothetical protein
MMGQQGKMQEAGKSMARTCLGTYSIGRNPRSTAITHCFVSSFSGSRLQPGQAQRVAMQGRKEEVR